MHERLVLCGGAERKGRQPTETLRLSLMGSQSNINLRLQDISRRMVTIVPDLLTDLVEIATYVLCADEAVSRGGDTRSALGAAWRRRLRFVIPVRTPDHWSSSGVADALTDVLTFLSDDEFSFEFTKQAKPPSFQTYLDLAHEGPAAFEADEIVLFSGAWTRSEAQSRNWGRTATVSCSSAINHRPRYTIDRVTLPVNWLSDFLARSCISPFG